MNNMLLYSLAQLQIEWDISQALAPFTWKWLPATACSMLVGIACGVLGCFVVLRRMALIGDALSHAVLPGVVIALLITGSTGVGGLLTGALLAGVITAVLINVVSRFSRTKEDSAIGIVFTAFFALGVVLISALPRGVHFDLKCFLFGDPLAVGEADLLMMAIVCPVVVGVIALLYHPLRLLSFDPILAAAMGLPVALFHYLLMGLLSATVVAGLKTTGVILVVAMVITPASAAYQLSNRLWSMLLLSGIFGALAAVLGMSLAFVTNSPTGPAMVLVATVIFGVVMLLSPNHGIVMQWLRRRNMRRHIEEEDLLKAIYHGGAHATPMLLAKAARLSARGYDGALQRLRAEGLVSRGDGNPRLTQDGEHRATEMVRSHRLWESYLAEEAKVDAALVHEEAERLEHAHELADEVDARLGRPKLDPHGVEIPRPRST